MLSKKQRVPTQLFLTAFKGGRFVHSPTLSLKVYKTDLPLQPSRFACVVSKKLAPRAVDRNYLRRRGYAVIQKHTDNIKNGFVGIFLFKKIMPNKKPFPDFDSEIISLIKQAHLFK